MDYRMIVPVLISFALSVIMGPVVIPVLKKLKMVKANELTFEEGCNMYLEDCRQRNLRDGTIRHYK